jgi:putative NIF3 family GTP cyclohydrolase 1 type 2
MKVEDISRVLDNEFLFNEEVEDLASWSYTEETQEYLYNQFLEKKTGLMIKASNKISEVFTCVFVTDEIINQIIDKRDALLVTHHNFDYYEDGRGLCPISKENIEKMLENNISLYVAHAGLDTHKIYGTSISLAELLEINVLESFYDYFGKPTAVIGSIKETNLKEFEEHVSDKIERKELTVYDNNKKVLKIAIVAGGGDEPAILQKAYDLGVDTLVGGTIKNTWKFPIVQEMNKRFHQLNEKLQLNIIGGSHYGTERPSMIKLESFFENLGLECSFIEDKVLLNTY